MNYTYNYLTKKGCLLRSKEFKKLPKKNQQVNVKKPQVLNVKQKWFSKNKGPHILETVSMKLSLMYTTMSQ